MFPRTLNEPFQALASSVDPCDTRSKLIVILRALIGHCATAYTAELFFIDHDHNIHNILLYL